MYFYNYFVSLDYLFLSIFLPALVLFDILSSPPLILLHRWNVPHVYG